MSTKNSNKLNVPEAKAAMDQFKMEAASEVGVNLKNGYNGHLTSGEAYRRTDGQEDDRVLREEPVNGPSRTKKEPPSGGSFLRSHKVTSVPLFTSMR